MSYVCEGTLDASKIRELDVVVRYHHILSVHGTMEADPTLVKHGLYLRRDVVCLCAAAAAI